MQIGGTQPRIARAAAAILLLAGAWSLVAAPAVRAQNAGQYLSAAVTVEMLDSEGNSLARVNGTALSAGVVIPSSALHGASKARIRSRDGSEQTSEYVLATNAVGVAILETPQPSANVIPIPTDMSFMPGGRATILEGPGAGTDSVSTKLFYVFALGDGVDYISTSAAVKGAAPCLDSTGRLIGVSMDLSAAGVSLGFLVPVGSLNVIVNGRGNPDPISAHAQEDPPAYESKATAHGLSFRGALLTVQERTEDARSFLNLALKEDPNSYDAHFWMGKVLLLEKTPAEHFDNAATEFQKAGAIEPTSRLAWHMAGVAYNQGSRYLEAEKMYKKALEADPTSAETYCNLGGAYYNEKRTDLSIQAFRKSIDLDPNYQRGLAYTNLALVYAGMGDRVNAEKVYQELLKVNPAWAKPLRDRLDGKP